MMKPDLKNSFSVEDIHKIREYNYETTKDMTKEELIDFINDGADSVREKIEKNRKDKLAV